MEPDPRTGTGSDTSQNDKFTSPGYCGHKITNNFANNGLTLQSSQVYNSRNFAINKIKHINIAHLIAWNNVTWLNASVIYKNCEN